MKYLLSQYVEVNGTNEKPEWFHRLIQDVSAGVIIQPVTICLSGVCSHFQRCIGE